MLYGVTISAFRNFGENEQWLHPLSRISIVIGSNNSGKSNVLRYIDRIVAPGIKSGRTKAIEQSPVDVPSTGGRVNSFAFWAKFDPIEITAAWQPEWLAAFKALALLDAEEKFILLRVTTGPVERGHRYAGGTPDADHFTKQVFQKIWMTISGSSGGGFEQHWFPGVMNRLVELSLEDLNTHFIPSFRQITSRMEQFQGEYAIDKGDDHIIDQIAALAYPSYVEQEKKLEFEKLRRFVGAIIDDADVSIEVPNDRKTINVKTGGTFLPIEALGSGIHEVFMLAAEIIVRPNATILLEEPEVHLHPTLQRRFMHFLSTETRNQIFITTHSSTIIDTSDASVFEIRKSDDQACVRVLKSAHERFEACREVGFRASDLLQTNSVIWVEGPSDRIYVLSWLANIAPDLQEGLHFSVMFYGGKLLSNLSIDDEAMNDFIKLLPLCRSPLILIDSDKANGNSTVRATKIRIQDEFAKISSPCWITEGREIENFYSRDDRLEAVQTVHTQVSRLVGGPSRYDKPITFQRHGSEKEVTADKIAVANYLVNNKKPKVELASFDRHLTEWVAYIRAANS